MASPLVNLGCGASIAILTVGLLIVPEIGGISTWKYVLAAIGFWMIVRSGRRSRR